MHRAESALRMLMMIGPILCGLSCDNWLLLRIFRKIRPGSQLSQARPDRIGPMNKALAQHARLVVLEGDDSFSLHLSDVLLLAFPDTH